MDFMGLYDVRLPPGALPMCQCRLRVMYTPRTRTATVPVLTSHAQVAHLIHPLPPSLMVVAMVVVFRVLTRNLQRFGSVTSTASTLHHPLM